MYQLCEARCLWHQPTTTCLHRATSSNDIRLVNLVIGWGQEWGISWEWDGGGNAEPWHQEAGLGRCDGSWGSGDRVQHVPAGPEKAVAAIQDDGGVLARNIEAAYREACNRWDVPSEGSGRAGRDSAGGRLPGGQQHGSLQATAGPCALGAGWEQQQQEQQMWQQREMQLQQKQEAYSKQLRDTSSASAMNMPRWMQLLQPEGQPGSGSGSQHGSRQDTKKQVLGPLVSCMKHMDNSRNAAGPYTLNYAISHFGLLQWFLQLVGSNFLARKRPLACAGQGTVSGSPLLFSSHDSRTSNIDNNNHQAPKLWQDRSLSNNRQVPTQRISAPTTKRLPAIDCTSAVSSAFDLSDAALQQGMVTGSHVDVAPGSVGYRFRLSGVSWALASLGLVLVVVFHVLCKVFSKK